MKLFCESATFSMFPALRALITRELMEKYNYNQSDVAKALGITQPAVSQYKKELRGHSAKILEKDQDVVNFVKNLCAEINSKAIQPNELQEKFCELCRILKDKKIVRGEDVA